MNFNPVFVPIALSIIGLIFMFFKARWVKKQDPGNEKMQTIASNISKGAMAFFVPLFNKAHNSISVARPNEILLFTF